MKLLFYKQEKNLTARPVGDPGHGPQIIALLIVSIDTTHNYLDFLFCLSNKDLACNDKTEREWPLG